MKKNNAEPIFRAADHCSKPAHFHAAHHGKQILRGDLWLQHFDRNTRSTTSLHLTLRKGKLLSRTGSAKVPRLKPRAEKPPFN